MFQDPLAGTAPNLTHGAEPGDGPAARAAPGAGPRRDRGAAPAHFREQLAPLGLGLENRLQTRAGLLSGGQRQALTLLMATLATPRAAVARRAHRGARPGHGGDDCPIDRPADRRSNLAVLMVTHHMGLALAMGTRTLMLHAGKIILDLSGAERQAQTVRSLVERFFAVRGTDAASDRMLLYSICPDAPPTVEGGTRTMSHAIHPTRLAAARAARDPRSPARAGRARHARAGAGGLWPRARRDPDARRHRGAPDGRGPGGGHGYPLGCRRGDRNSAAREPGHRHERSRRRHRARRDGNHGRSRRDRHDAAHGEPRAAAKKYTIGILQTATHPALDFTREGVKQAFLNAGMVEGSTVTFDVRNAELDAPTAAKMVDAFVASNADAIVAIGSLAAQAALAEETKQGSKIPLFFTAVADPYAAKLAGRVDGATTTADPKVHPDFLTGVQAFPP